MTEFIDDEDVDNEDVDADDRYVLQDRYLVLTQTCLPAAARRQGWAVREDHCFMRIVLDQLFKDCWYNHLDRRLTAYKQLNVEQLRLAVHLAEQLLRLGEPLLKTMNRQSLQWRSKK